MLRIACLALFASAFVAAAPAPAEARSVKSELRAIKSLRALLLTPPQVSPYPRIVNGPPH
jgi:hypothetical protein